MKMRQRQYLLEQCAYEDVVPVLGAFAVVPPVGRRVYFRGGDSDDLHQVLSEIAREALAADIKTVVYDTLPLWGE